MQLNLILETLNALQEQQPWVFWSAIGILTLILLSAIGKLLNNTLRYGTLSRAALYYKDGGKNVIKITAPRGWVVKKDAEGTYLTPGKWLRWKNNRLSRDPRGTFVIHNLLKKRQVRLRHWCGTDLCSINPKESTKIEYVGGVVRFKADII